MDTCGSYVYMEALWIHRGHKPTGTLSPYEYTKAISVHGSQRDTWSPFGYMEFI